MIIMMIIKVMPQFGSSINYAPRGIIYIPRGVICDVDITVVCIKKIF